MAGGPVEGTVGLCAGACAGEEARDLSREGDACVPLPGLEDQGAMTSQGAPTESGDGSGLERRGGHWVSTPGPGPLVLRPFHSPAWWVVEAGTGGDGAGVMGGDQQGLGKWGEGRFQGDITFPELEARPETWRA